MDRKIPNRDLTKKDGASKPKKRGPEDSLEGHGDASDPKKAKIDQKKDSNFDYLSDLFSRKGLFTLKELEDIQRKWENTKNEIEDLKRKKSSITVGYNSLSSSSDVQSSQGGRIKVDDDGIFHHYQGPSKGKNGNKNTKGLIADIDKKIAIKQKLVDNLLKVKRYFNAFHTNLQKNQIDLARKSWENLKSLDKTVFDNIYNDITTYYDSKPDLRDVRNMTSIDIKYVKQEIDNLLIKAKENVQLSLDHRRSDDYTAKLGNVEKAQSFFEHNIENHFHGRLDSETQLNEFQASWNIITDKHPCLKEIVYKVNRDLANRHHQLQENAGDLSSNKLLEELKKEVTLEREEENDIKEIYEAQKKLYNFCDFDEKLYFIALDHMLKNAAIEALNRRKAAIEALNRRKDEIKSAGSGSLENDLGSHESIPKSDKKLVFIKFNIEKNAVDSIQKILNVEKERNYQNLLLLSEQKNMRDNLKLPIYDRINKGQVAIESHNKHIEENKSYIQSLQRLKDIGTDFEIIKLLFDDSVPYNRQDTDYILGLITQKVEDCLAQGYQGYIVERKNLDRRKTLVLQQFKGTVVERYQRDLKGYENSYIEVLKSNISSIEKELEEAEHKALNVSHSRSRLLDTYSSDLASKPIGKRKIETITDEVNQSKEILKNLNSEITRQLEELKKIASSMLKINVLNSLRSKILNRFLDSVPQCITGKNPDKFAVWKQQCECQKTYTKGTKNEFSNFTYNINEIKTKYSKTLQAMNSDTQKIQSKLEKIETQLAEARQRLQSTNSERSSESEESERSSEEEDRSD